jgi:hypothetical protein
VALALGVFAAVFVASGFGWGWPDLTTGDARFIRFKTGLAVGLLFAAFGWLLSRRFSGWVAASILLNVVVVVMLPGYDFLRLLGFALGNHLVLFLWLSQAQSRQR